MFAMRIIPVIDLLGGRVVRGVGGRRSEYRPVESQIAADSQPVTVARAFALRFGFETAYVADLDAILHGSFSVAAWKEIAAARLSMWLDAGIGTHQAGAKVEAALQAAGIEATLVIGLESLIAPGPVLDLVKMFGPKRVVFSLDLRGGQPLLRRSWAAMSPAEIARYAVDIGYNRIIVLDLADVGEARGTGTLELCSRLRASHPHIELIAGGGVRGVDDLQRLADVGCDAALVASALHDGQLTRADVEAATHMKSK